MKFRVKRVALLSALFVLLALAVVDIWVNKENVLESFSRQFLNEAKTDALHASKRSASATAERLIEVNRSMADEVHLSAEGDPITVKRSTGQMIQLQYKITAYGATNDEADQRLNKIDVSREVTAGLLTFAAKAGGKPVDPDEIDIEYTLLVPDGFKVKVDSNRGDIRIEGVRADVNVEAAYGNMEIVDVSGYVAAKSSYGSLYISGVTGNVELNNQSSAAKVEQVSGWLTLNNHSGKMSVSQIAGEATINSTGGSITMRDMASPVMVESRRADLMFDRVANHIQVDAEYGKITLILAEADGYTVDASTFEGRIQTLLPVAVEREKETSRLRAVIGKGTWKAEIKAIRTDMMIHTK
ncbi:MAG: hypothetical protein K0Q59_2150 [Paenibacillus sp.]|nr:hypothetical protein [Paenibacillus sp.]